MFQVYSLMLATFLGAMGLPHVLVRFYTNPDGRAARLTSLVVIALVGVFYLFPVLLGVFARLYVPQLLITGTSDAAVLLLPVSVFSGWGGHLLAALVAAGAIAAFHVHVVGAVGEHRRCPQHRRAARVGSGTSGSPRSSPERYR